MKKVFILLLVLLTVSCKNNPVKENVKKDNSSSEVIEMENNKMEIKIKNEVFKVNLVDNETTKELVKMLPLNIKMNELNGNEKYYYLAKDLPTNSYYPKKINKGDIMLYDNNCLVLFYQTFDTDYSYTKIGQIDNPDNLDKIVGNSDIEVTIS